MENMNHKLSTTFILIFVIVNICACNVEKNAFSTHKSTCPSNQDNFKLCRVRDRIVERRIWNQWTGYYCYYYTTNYRLKFKYNFELYNLTCANNNIVQIPISKKGNEIFWYDYTNQTSLDFIRPSFKTEDFFNLWLSCCEEAVDCCENHMNNSNIIGDENYPCPAIWDAWSCFPASKADSVVKLPCSKQAYSTTTDVCELQSEKVCFANGTWNPTTNYAVCAIAPVLRSRHEFHVIVLSIAATIAFPAVVLFFCYQKFRTMLRICLHRNLITVIVIRNILTIIVKEVIILDALRSDSNHIMDENGVGCRVLAFFENYAKNGIYTCMLVDGFYLHKLIVRPLADEPKSLYIYIITFVLPLIPSLIWASVRGAKAATDCWMVDTDNDQWISDGFRIFILTLNVILLFDIIRVMLSKLKKGSVTKQLKTTFRATLFLLPLFGVNIIVTSNPGIVNSDSCTAETVFYFVSYSLEALQGIFVALLFCYLSSEVQGKVRQSLDRFCQSLEDRFGWELWHRNGPKRRDTAATYIYQS